MEQFTDIAFWLALAKIVWVNIMLSGDNAVVIALAARNLPPHQRTRAVVAGSAAAIGLRVVLTVFAVNLLQFPYLKIVGALALLWIGVQLLVPESEDEAGIDPATHLWAAVRTILVADLVMSVDNVLGVAAAADGGPPESRLLLLLLGLGMSIPLIVFGSQVLLGLMERLPVIVRLGAALLGFVAGEMLVGDRALAPYFEALGRGAVLLVEVAGAVAVVVVGTALARRHRRRSLAV